MDISNLKDIFHNPIDYSFTETNKLKNIKISWSINKEEVDKNFENRIFLNIGKSIGLLMKKDVECNIPF